MVVNVIECAYPGCDFQSENDSEAVACARLQSHAFLHTPIPGPALKTAAQDSRGPKLEKPTITIGIISRRIEISSLIACGFLKMNTR